jgi:hypothetical protein
VNVVENPAPIVKQLCDVNVVGAFENRVPELSAALSGERRPRQHYSNFPTLFGDQIPKPPSKRLVNIRIAGAHSRKRSAYEHTSQQLSLFPLSLIEAHQVAPFAPISFLRGLLLALGQRMEARIVAGPETVLFDCRLLPWRIAKDHVEAGALAQEDFREMQSATAAAG